MQLTVDRMDLNEEHKDVPCSFTKFKHFQPKVQKAICAVDKATFWEYDRSSYNAIYPPRITS